MATVAVCGGGPAGGVAALVLAQRGIAVTLITGGKRTGHSSSSAQFAQTLPAPGRHLLSRLGLPSDSSEEYSAELLGTYSSWGSTEALSNDSILNPLGNGLRLDRRAFDTALHDAAVRTGATLADSRVVALRRGKRASTDGWTITCDVADENRRELEVDIVIDATGRPARIARQCAQVRRVTFDSLVSFAATVVVSPTTDRRAVAEYDSTLLVESSPDGWWFSVVAANGVRALQFFCDRQEFPKGMSNLEMTEAALQTQHVKALVAGSHKTLSRPRRIVASSSAISPVVGSDWLAVGDAAMTFDPLSSQGVFAAMRGGVAAATSIEEDRALIGAGRRDRSPFASYREFVHETWLRYVEQIRTVYSWEQRWPQSDFWRKRLPPPN